MVSVQSLRSSFSSSSAVRYRDFGTRPPSGTSHWERGQGGNETGVPHQVPAVHGRLPNAGEERDPGAHSVTPGDPTLNPLRHACRARHEREPAAADRPQSSHWCASGAGTRSLRLVPGSTASVQSAL